MVADADPIHLGSVYAAFDRIIGGGVNTANVEVFFHPRRNAVALEFRREFVTYRQFWDETARRQFIAGLERYNADFEARALVNRPRQTRSVYGRVSARLEWQTMRFTVLHVAYPTIDIGYRFRENAPFFATLMRSARSAEEMGGGSGQTESRQMFMYFTRDWAADLAAMFDQSFLMGLPELRDVPAQAPPPAAWDAFPLNGREAEAGDGSGSADRETPESSVYADLFGSPVDNTGDFGGN